MMKKNYQIEARLRKKLIFKRANLLNAQPPAQNLSLVLCKNVLLHLSPEEQSLALATFHRSLLPGGLFAVENTQNLPAEFADCFEKATGKARIYRNKGECRVL